MLKKKAKKKKSWNFRGWWILQFNRPDRSVVHCKLYNWCIINSTKCHWGNTEHTDEVNPERTVWKDFICLRDFLKLPLCLVLVVGVFIWMPLQGEFSVPVEQTQRYELISQSLHCYNRLKIGVKDTVINTRTKWKRQTYNNGCILYKWLSTRDHNTLIDLNNLLSSLPKMREDTFYWSIYRMCESVVMYLCDRTLTLS